ncbi:MAG: DUF2147 domain-containing protein [Bacteroidota bacterium]
MKQFSLSVLLLLLFTVIGYSQNAALGTWKTIDDATGDAKSHVEIYEQNGKVYGKIVKLLKSEPGVVCDECKGKKKGKPVLGMVIIEDLQKGGDVLEKGTILDPENGKEYKCKIWFEEGKTDELKLRGYHWTGLYRTQTWYRVK